MNLRFFQMTNTKKTTWNTYVITLFPEMFPGPLNFSLVGKALKEKIWSLNLINLRDFAENGPKSIDDKPYGGGPGMVIKNEVVDNALKKITKKIKQYSLIYLTPQGKKINQKKVKELVRKNNLILLCGKYEGIDQRVIENWNMEELSVGDFVLSGGEIAAMGLLDSCVRLLPKVIGSSESLEYETFENNLLEHPHYTKPSNWKGKRVPNILLTGNHQKIKEWRKKKSFEVTKLKRPDLLKK